VLIDEAQCRDFSRCEKHHFPQYIIPESEIMKNWSRKGWEGSGASRLPHAKGVDAEGAIITRRQDSHAEFTDGQRNDATHLQHLRFVTLKSHYKLYRLRCINARWRNASQTSGIRIRRPCAPNAR
jgi:hypothetical protein